MHGHEEIIELLVHGYGEKFLLMKNFDTHHLDIYSSNDLGNDLCTLWFSGADPNIRDHSGKKAKQYLPTYASTRAHRKRMTSYSDFELSRHCRPTAQTHHGSLIITHLSLDNSDFMSSEA